MSGYKLDYTGEEINNLLKKMKNISEDGSNNLGLKFEIVTELPATDIDNTAIYLIQTNSGDYTEWIFVNDTWEMLGSTDINLTNYATKEYVDSTIEEAIEAALEEDY